MADRSRGGASNDGAIHITPVATQTAEIHILGLSPLIVNRVSEKAMRELLLPGQSKNRAERAATLKHSPLDEFRASPYLSDDPQSPTYLTAPAMWFKNAMKTAALDLPGTSKTQIGRLCWVAGDMVPVWGVPQLLMSIVRSADINHTPDIRSRAIVRRWAATLKLQWVVPMLNEQSIVNLLATGGLTSGVGDWRVQKGSGSYGQFRVVNNDDAEYLEVLGAGGYDAQFTAMAEPGCYDKETGELLAWATTEAQRRGMAGSAISPK